MPYTLQILSVGDLNAVRLKVIGSADSDLIPDADLLLDSIAGFAEYTVMDRVTDWATIKASGTARNQVLLRAAAVAAIAAVVSPNYPPVRQETFGASNTSYATESVEARTLRLYGERDQCIAAISTQPSSTETLMATASIDYDGLGAPHVYDGADLA